MLAFATFSATAGFCNQETVALPSVSQSEFEALLHTKPEYRYSVFTNPVQGLQLGGEYMYSQNVAGFFYLCYTAPDFKSIIKILERQPSAASADDSTETEKKITFHKSKTMTANFGTRYFFRPSTDGWFLGSLVRYQKDYAKADYDETIGRITRVTAGPQGHGGHRWIWRHGGFIDLFAGALVLVYDRQTSNWETDDQTKKESAQKAYDKIANPSFMRYVVPELNISMGYLIK